MTPSHLHPRLRSTSNSPITLSSNSDGESPTPRPRPSFLPSPLSIRNSSSTSMRSPPLRPPLQSPGSHNSSLSMASFPPRAVNKLRKAQSSTALTSDMVSSPHAAVPPLRIPKRDTSVARESPMLCPHQVFDDTSTLCHYVAIPRSFPQRRQDSAEATGSDMNARVSHLQSHLAPPLGTANRC